MWSAIGRATAQPVRIGGRLWVRSASRLAARLPGGRAGPVIPSGIRVAAVFSRGYAQVGRPRKTSTAATSEVAKKKPATKTKKVAAKKNKLAAKAKKVKKAKKAPAAKKAKPAKPKTPLTAEEKLKRDIARLRKKAMYKEEPDRLPETSWLVYTTPRVKDVYNNSDAKLKLSDVMARLAVGYKALSATELDELRAVAEQNKTANQVALREWIQTHPPQRIHDANLARKLLRRKHKASTGHFFADPRYPAKAMNSYAAFVKSRFHASDVDDPTTSQAKLTKISAEWKQLSAEERKVRPVPPLI
ncbi:hypothetical protein N658DRAFT_487369 [Parathielavia hyrcaniae]|uniref:HMG box domain-containing protein n=1 Tax=Parathielavia hyrcaniae TaxID=113614 RepID=A0AAN6T021_9PEZI|nr:hypothetical protein N658DRAFT_487369 [Parathielavia hyrcaniae]